MQKTLYEYCQEMGREELLREWDQDRNAPITPEQVAYGSHRMAWWVCQKGHRWQAMVKSRAAGTGCPVCANRAVLPGENDLAASFPEVAAQWHPSKNGALTPRDVPPGTQRKVWWLCEKGHAWQARVSTRTYGGSGCPVCAGKQVAPGENDLATMYPDIAKEWHPTRNGAITPQGVTPYSNRKAWWLCPRGHEYQAVVATRTSHHSGCPYCTGRKALRGFNDLATLYPDLAREWHPTLNGSLTPEMVTPGSHKRVWWICQEGHVWRAVIYPRTGKKQCGCPVCAGTAGQRRHKMEPAGAGAAVCARP